MYYSPPKKSKLAVLYLRQGPDVPAAMDLETQEAACRAYCAERCIPVSHAVRVHCDGEESLRVLESLLRTLPPAVDTILAARFFCYSTKLPELGRLCLAFQCRPTWLYSFDIVGPIQGAFHTLTAEDYELADQRYLELLHGKAEGSGKLEEERFEKFNIDKPLKM